MKIKLILIYIEILVAISLSAYAQSSDDFVAHFFDRMNIADYVKKIDGLIELGEANIFDSIEDTKRNLPKTECENGIVMAYSIHHTPEGIMHHFSTSRPPYLAIPFGMNIVALFEDRAGLPFPPEVYISENQVFHADWFFPNNEAEQAKIEAVNRRKENRKEADLDKILERAIGEGIRLLRSSNM